VVLGQKAPLIPNMNDAAGMAIALEEAKISYEEGGIPVCP
jgi:hypothetical protein